MALAVVILAAGKGTRMKSPYPKVLHLLAGEPMIIHVVETALTLRPDQLLVVVGYKADLVKKALKGYELECILQKEQLGTGDAVKRVKPHLLKTVDQVLVLCGDTPLLTPQTLTNLITLHQEQKATVSILTAYLEDPSGYGRLVRDQSDLVQKIVEEKDASLEEKKIKEINSGVYVFEREFLFEALEKIRPDNVQQEYYLTDVVEMAVKDGRRVAAYLVSDPIEILGVNSQVERARLEEIYQTRLRQKFMAQGVSLVLPETVYLERKVEISPGTVVFPFVVLRGQTRIEAECTIESFCYLEDVKVGPGAVIKAGSVLKGVSVPPSGRVQGSFSLGD